jgi:hypothetical protein
VQLADESDVHQGYDFGVELYASSVVGKVPGPRFAEPSDSLLSQQLGERCSDMRLWKIVACCLMILRKLAAEAEMVPGTRD